MKILVLEDTKEIALIVTRLLERHGHSVRHVENGREGLEQLTHDDFDLIVSDVQMPVMDGITFALTARNRGLKAPILLFTGEPYLDPRELQGARVTAIFEKLEVGAMVATINRMDVARAVR